METIESSPPLAARSLLSAITAGMIASLADSVLFTVARVAGLTSYNKEFLIAKAWIGFAQNPAVWMLGLVMGVGIGGITGWIYSLGFQGIRARKQSGWDTGIALGGVHWIIAGLIIGYFASAGQSADSPGYFGLNLGWPTFILFFLSHLLFGAIVGGLYLPPAQITPKHETNGEEMDEEQAENFSLKAS